MGPLKPVLLVLHVVMFLCDSFLPSFVSLRSPGGADRRPVTRASPGIKASHRTARGHAVP
eukprot:3730590-Prymnesium_polylepis.1